MLPLAVTEQRIFAKWGGTLDAPPYPSAGGEGVKQYWCLHCQRVFSAPRKPDDCQTPGCSGHYFDLQEVAVEGLLDPWPDHWPAQLEDGAFYALYQ